MLQGWNFLLGEIWLILVLAIILGLLAGWLIFGGKKEVKPDPKLEEEVKRLRKQLEDLQSKDRVKALPAPERVGTGASAGLSDVFEEVDEGTRPEALSGPRKGVADDLKMIKGIGPQLEQVCNDLGFYHFDQISAWTDEEIQWVDANLEGFRGRATRDKWVRQAKILARGGSTEFSQKIKRGEIQY